MPDIRINKLRNRLTVCFHRQVPSHVPAFVQKLEAACQALVPGFICLAVIPIDGFGRQGGRDFFIHTTDLIAAYGARKMVCVRAAGRVRRGHLAPIPVSLQSRMPVKQAADFKEAENLMRG